MAPNHDRVPVPANNILFPLQYPIFVGYAGEPEEPHNLLISGKIAREDDDRKEYMAMIERQIVDSHDHPIQTVLCRPTSANHAEEAQIPKLSKLPAELRFRIWNGAGSPRILELKPGVVRERLPSSTCLESPEWKWYQNTILTSVSLTLNGMDSCLTLRLSISWDIDIIHAPPVNPLITAQGTNTQLSFDCLLKLAHSPYGFRAQRRIYDQGIRIGLILRSGRVSLNNSLSGIRI